MDYNIRSLCGGCTCKENLADISKLDKKRTYKEENAVNVSNKLTVKVPEMNDQGES